MATSFTLSTTFTLTATLADVTGAPIGTVANPAKLRIALCGFGQTLPCVEGVGNVAQIVTEIATTDGAVSTEIIPNNLITPPNTYYEISVIDGQGNVAQSGLYQCDNTTGSPVTVDLSELAQIVQPTVAGATWVQKEYYYDGAETTSVTLPYPVAPGSLVTIFLGPATVMTKLIVGQYTVSGSVITFAEPTNGLIDILYWTALG